MKTLSSLLVCATLAISVKPVSAAGHSPFSLYTTKITNRFVPVCPHCDKQLKRVSSDKKKTEAQPVAAEKKATNKRSGN
jgi:hypothetical protein